VTERTPFELATAELRKRGITLRQLPGEYQVNLTGGPDENALSAETLDEAIELGRDMAKTLAPAATTSTATPGKPIKAGEVKRFKTDYSMDTWVTTGWGAGAPAGHLTLKEEGLTDQ
jgi:hypothetical protein